MSAIDRKGKSLRITPNAEHLTSSVTERACRKNAVNRLLWVLPLNVNVAGTPVVELAKVKREKGDGIGQWLLNQLMEWASDGN